MSKKIKMPTRIPLVILRLLFTGQWRAKPCAHRAQIKFVAPTAHVCAECVASGDTWPELRMCMICGYVGCCDQARNQHARKHYAATKHPLMRSIERGANWMWCYEHNALLAAPK